MKYKIKDAVDGLGEQVSVWHGDNIGQLPAVCAMYLRATTFLLDKGWAMAPFALVNNTHHVIWVENAEGVPMGGVVFEYHAHNKQGWIVLIFTEEEFRGRHIYSITQEAFENQAIRLGATSIASMAHKDNVARLTAGTREGMDTQYLRLYKDLTPVLTDRKIAMVSERGKPWNEINIEQWSTPNRK